MCGGFTCSKNALTALNVLYIVVAFILIGVAVYGRASALVTNLPIIGGILACGVILFLISILGLIGAIKHHQVLLFFYMVILFLLFLIQFSIACACLAVNPEQQEQLAEEGWKRVNNELKMKVQNTFSCCGFEGSKLTGTPSMDHPTCVIVNEVCCESKAQPCECEPCMQKLQSTIDYAFKLCGGIGLFFSFTEFVGVWLTVRYRNQKDPRANPSAFL
ncbi:tetraspanin-31-A isoform X2 [Neodiprion virginianus]|uniref:Tetraspanin-31-A isoform X2 n=1 Tax=Neodiprion lecontei TaxID=441921 RepID=A0ABM3G7U0_NEOLC|nr:tetraspanin-31-A isoform X2 [Neodiprion fabricii]XP_046416130.1 tetraspanin-31-A isoform X2 [Neodiprion fabricii]XP_046481171.1 tetraspanin-31-A isoform X2 [Neodiprion pinetum]XP_046481180.1 tetraspanin-31-A isoform X2 [Neodiprion pinetum]XP_046596321.1 tetraspanin-31-A isoform X2 [Neodiprion lecontei]XP_046596332.1 tetraspanin-31-A isoform X2 [Neodiprion lecontei]XP_046608434.1 tetraspanin-31-A isoform X2 [Neodiprion virginianus]XP_046608444.1 tetraspanin-31-A isoform X2 [Neodiprion virg